MRLHAQSSAKVKDPNTKKSIKLALPSEYVLHIMTNGTIAVGEGCCLREEGCWRRGAIRCVPVGQRPRVPVGGRGGLAPMSLPHAAFCTGPAKHMAPACLHVLPQGRTDAHTPYAAPRSLR
jgi:hypothetical protein